MATDVDQLIDELIAREGGYSNNPNDSGGETNFGITAATARANGYGGPMRAMPRSVAVDIYRRIYWLRPRFDEVAKRSERIGFELFDTGVNCGQATAAIFLQRSLSALNRGARDYPDIKADGAIGDATLAALDGYFHVRGEAGETVLLIALNALQGERYISLAEHTPGDESFLYGWLANRVGNAL